MTDSLQDAAFHEMEVFSPLSPKGEDKWFFALQPSAAARETIVRQQDELGLRHGFQRYRIKPENLHVTIQMVGHGTTLPPDILRAAYAAAAAVSCRPFDISFDRALSFKSKKLSRPFVLMCAKTALAPLQAFHRALIEALHQHGLIQKRHPDFTPHLTLFWDPASIPEHPVTPLGWTVNEFVLVHSRVGRSEHRVVGRWVLDGEPKRPPLTCPTRWRSRNEHPYVELHARSAFSFLRGASLPENLAQSAMELGLPAMALLDRDGVYGAPRFYSSAQENSFTVRPRVGAEITMEDGTVLPLLATSRTGYQNLCQLITEAKLTDRIGCALAAQRLPPSPPKKNLHALTLRDRKRPCFATWDELARFNEGLIALTGDEDGPVRHAWRTRGPAAVASALEKLTAIFGRDSDPARARLFVELQRHRVRGEEREITFLRDLAAAQNLPLLATGGVNYAIPEHRLVSDVFTCLRHHTTLDAAGRLLDLNAHRHLKSGAEIAELFADLPEAIANSTRIEERLQFSLKNLGYQFPQYHLPSGESVDQDAYLRQKTYEAARSKFGHLSEAWRNQLEKELSLIARLGFSGYFLIVWDICAWARDKKILVQGRGSAANSAVCYVLGITSVDPIKNKLLFDRFLNDSRVGKDGRPSWPDIDLDFPSGDRRETVIQEVYNRYGRRGAAMTANVISYRGRNSVREIGKVLGFGEDALDRFSSLYANGDFPETLQLQQQLAMAGIAHDHPRAAAMVRLQHYIRGNALPRHLGQHSGGMVICAGQLDKVVPLEPATMPDRSVCQWDKDDCENLGIVKIDFLGLGMMAVLQETVELCIARNDPKIRALDHIPPDDPETYEKIRAADTVGVFQIESRAQMATLPRFKPRDLYDLAMQVAIVRPGPITGHLVHPLIRRRNREEDEEYIDPSVEHIVRPILERTKGVILFQEQMLQLAINLAKFTGGEAEELRRAMGFTKDPERLPKSMRKLTEALRREGYNESVVQKVVTATTSFSAYGFPESHAIGFAQLAYASTWLKIHRPAEFYASLLNNQPMGFYSPATLIQDGRRHGLKTNPVCIAHSKWECTVEGEKVIRIGLRYVQGLRETAARTMIEQRDLAPFSSMDDFLRRTDFTATERRALASVGALNALTPHRRAALWEIEAAWSDEENLFKHFAETDRTPSPLTPMTRPERLAADFHLLSLTTGCHPMALLRDRLPGVHRAKDLKDTKTGELVTIAGSVICRQRPGTASGVVFISLEDETGIANAVVLPALFEHYRLLITQESALRITGVVQNVSHVIHVKARHIEALREATLPAQASHDFH
jgi:DNA-directed DNA polymerase III (polc)